MLCLSLPAAFAQAPSLAGSDQYVVTVDTANGKETYTVIRDGRIPEQFYYVPIKPTIATEVKNGKTVPVFQLTSYQTKDEKDQLIQGGILQMSMVTGVPAATVDKIRSKLFSLKVPAGKVPRLSPLPVKSAELTIYGLDGLMLDQAPPKSGVAPIFGTQHYPFMLKLKDLGTDIMKALCTRNGGLPVLITYTFQGMTPKVGAEVKVDWDACYEHFSTNTKVALDVAKNAVSGGLGLDISTLREEFISKGLIEIKTLTDETLDAKQLDEIMKPVLDLITKELFEQIHAPASIPPAEVEKLKEDQAKPPIAAAAQGISETFMKATGRFFKVGVKVDFALKDVKIVKKGTFTYNFSRQAIVDRTTSFGGLLGIGNYSDDIQKNCMVTVPAGRWESAYYILPAVGDPAELGISTLNVSVMLEEKSGDEWRPVAGYKKESAGFNVTGDAIWTDKDRKEITRFLYPLKALYDSDNFKPENYRFNVTTVIKPKTGKTIEVVSSSSIFDGDLPIAPPTDLVDVVTIDGSCLTFGENPGEVYKVVGQLKAGRNAWNILLTGEDSIQTFLVPVDEKDIHVTSMSFAQKKGMLGKWRDSNKNLRELEPSLWFMLFDGDWASDADLKKLSEDVIRPFN